MGNCLMRSSNRVLAEHDDDNDVLNKPPRKAEEAVVDDQQITQQESSSPPLKLEAHDVKEAGKGKKKTVRFRLHEEEEEEEGDEIHENGGGKLENNNNNNNKSGVVRIKVVLSRQELKQIIMGYETSNKDNNNSHISFVEEFLNVIKSTGRRVSQVRQGINNNGSWRPALESIAEEQSYS